LGRDGTGAGAGVSNVDLLVLEGADAGKRFTFDEAEIAIGREPGSGICLGDSSVSPRHAVLRMQGDRLLIQKLPEASGSLWINEVDCSDGELQPGDRVRVGRVLLEVKVHAGMSLRSILAPLTPAGTDATAGPGDAPGSAAEDDGQTLLRPVSLVTV